MNQNFFNLSTQKKLVMDATMLAALQRDAVRRALEHNQISDADIRSTMEALSLNLYWGCCYCDSSPKGKKRGPKKSKKDSGSDSEATKKKRAPSAYNLFVKAHLSAEKETLIESGTDTKEAVKKAMATVGEMWKAHKAEHGISSGEVAPPEALSADTAVEEEEEVELEAIEGTEFGYDPKTMIAYNPTTGNVVGNMVDGTFVPNE